MRNLHCRFDWHYIGQIYGGDFAKFCGLLRIYELYVGILFIAIIKFSTKEVLMIAGILDRLIKLV